MSNDPLAKKAKIASSRGRLLIAAGFTLLLLVVIAQWNIEQTLLFPGSRADRVPPIVAKNRGMLPYGLALAWIGGQSVSAAHQVHFSVNPVPESLSNRLSGKSEAFLLSPTVQIERSPLLIYCHGNGELVDYWLEKFEAFRSQGFSILLVEYPGYGRSGGTASQRSIQNALVTAYDWAVQQPGIDPHCVIGWGRSLGGGAICTLAEKRPLAAVILESTFSSVGEVAYEQFGVPSFFIRNQFNNLATVKSLKVPLLILHGEQDQAISVANARRLHSAAPGSELEILACDHNDCPDATPRILQFLMNQGVVKKEELATDER